MKMKCNRSSCESWFRASLLASLLAVSMTVGTAVAQTPATGAVPPVIQPEAAIDTAATAWLLMSTGLVLFMVVGLALFYGGLVRRKNVLNTMMMSFVALGVVAITWALFGYSLAYADGGRFVGGTGHFFLNNLSGGDGVPLVLDLAFQGAFAIIATALVSGAVVERMRFSAYMLFIALWSVLIYAPLAHWAWGGGLFDNLFGRSAIDFAGGTVVHINAAVSALVLALLLGKRRDHGLKAMLPHQIPFTLLGAGILWFGWFGFNGGSAYAADTVAAVAFLNTLLAPAAALVVWALLDMRRAGKVTAVGLATAIVVGLVGITPGAGVMSPLAALVVGALAVLPCYWAITWRTNSSIDDSLDVFAAHGIGGIVGALLTGVLVSTAWGGEVGGSLAQLATQAAAIAISIAFSAVGTLAIATGVRLLVPLRAVEAHEAMGLDVPMHGEEGYTDGEGALLIPVVSSSKAAQFAGRGVKSRAGKGFEEGAIGGKA
ncbi:MAG: ammonium transporter [Trueperaceae bacterium]